MVRLTKEEKAKAKEIINLRNSITKEIAELDKSTKNKSEADLKKLIKLCKQFEQYTNELKDYGYKVDIWHKRLDHKTWEAELKNKTSIKSVYKKAAKSSKAENKKTVNNIADQPSEFLYYVMLCWTARQDYCICESIIKNVQNYFEKMHLEYMDVMSNDFPDRIEYCKTYKLKTTPEVYRAIINSAEYIIEISTGSIYEKCNIGVFGQKIE